MTHVLSLADFRELYALDVANGEKPKLSPEEQYRLQTRAVNAINEFGLNKSGISYAQLGYNLGGGKVPSPKLREHLLIQTTERNARKKET